MYRKYNDNISSSISIQFAKTLGFALYIFFNKECESINSFTHIIPRRGERKAIPDLSFCYIISMECSIFMKFRYIFRSFTYNKAFIENFSQYNRIKILSNIKAIRIRVRNNRLWNV